LEKALETGHFLKGVSNWLVFGKVFGIGQFGNGTLNWSFWERRLKLVRVKRAFETCRCRKGVGNWLVRARCLEVVRLRNTFGSRYVGKIFGTDKFAICIRI
jgi:hypothetical protein